jgi:hypothetical protein
VAQERVSRRDLPTQIPRSWVLTRRDRSLRPRQQREFMANLGGVEEVIEIDSCHDVMIRAPRRLAEVLIAEADRPSPSVRP